MDLNRYLGLWYEIGRYPNSFQKDCLDSTAMYTARPDGKIDVLNSCRDAQNGSLREAKGRAWVIDNTSNARLNVSFFWPFRGDYWIIELGRELREITKIDGAPIEVNINYLDADLKILTGLIEPHFYAGFSGSRKSILPGISSFETMRFMHSFKVIDQLQQANCRLENNLFHQYAMEVTEIAGVDFILNVVINKERQLAGVFGGHYDLAHQAGCKLVAEHAVANLPEKLDLVVTSAGGYPLDATFYQVSKCLIAARDILKEKGTILVTCGCQEGLGSEEFCTIMRSNPTPADFNLRHSDPDNFVIDQWCAQNIYQALAHAGKIFIYSPGLSEEDVARFQGIKVVDCQATVDDLLKTHKNVAVIPDGPYVVGKIVNQ